MKISFLDKSLPGWLRAISVLYYLATAFSAALAVLSFTRSSLITKAPGFTQSIASYNSAFIALGVIFIALSIFSFFVALGLQNRSNKARIALLAFCGLNILGGIVSVIGKSYLSFVNIAFNSAVFSYLLFSKKIRKEFGGKQAAY